MKNLKPALILFVFLPLALSSCKEDDDVSACELSPDAGNCEAYVPKYYYDQTDGQCKEFIWGGCGGTVPFDTMEECRACQ